MSKSLTSEDILFRQRFLSCCGFYTDTLDGLWGPNTDAAEKAFAAKSAAIAIANPTFDARSERCILSLQCNAQQAARISLKAIRATGLDARIISGTRTYPEQRALYLQGRFGNPGPIVTRANAGQSWHNFGLAWDIGIFVGGNYLDDGPKYRTAGGAGKVGGVTWGGDWAGGFKDLPHYELIPAGQSVADARAVYEAGGR